MVLHRSGRAAGGLVTVAAVTAGLAASLGAGYTVAQTTLQDSSAYVTKGNAVSHVNGESRRVDATSTGPALSDNGDRVITRATPSGEVIAINQRTGTVTTIDRGTMSPTSTVTPKRAVIKPPDVISSGRKSWLIDYDARAVRPMRNGVAVGGIDIDGRPVDAAPGPDGSVLVLTREGKLFRIDTDSKVVPVDVDDAEQAALTVAAGRTYLVSRSGVVVDVYGDGARKVATARGVAPAPDGRMLTGSIQASGPHVLIVSAALLAIVDPDSGSTGELVPLGTGDRTLGEPVEYRGRVFIPDFDRHKLVVVDVAGKALQSKPIDVPGTQRYFDLFVTGGKLWANDQYAQRLVQLDGTREHQIDKGPGNGVKPDPRPSRTKPNTDRPTTKPSTGSGTPPPSTRPDTGSNGGNTGPARPEYVTVPSFPAGTTVEDACNRLIELRLRCNQVPREEVGKEDGEVIRTRPGLPAKVAVGDSVTVVYVGPTEVPTLAPGTQPIAACADAITEAGLRCAYAPAARPADDPAQFGTVAGTSPDAGSKIGNGETVTIRYYDSFVMPDFNGKPGPDSCRQLSSLSLTLPDAAGRPQPAVHPACTKVEGDPAAKGSEDKANNVYRQQPATGSVYRPGGASITLTTHSAQVNLPDYRFVNGYGKDAEQAVTECSRLFDCSLSDQPRPAVDGGAKPERVNKVAAMLDDKGNDIEPGKKYDIGKTKIRIVKYTDQSTVPDVSNMAPDAACDAVTKAGFTCTRNISQPTRTANVVNGQSPAPNTGLGINQPVTISYYDKQVKPLYRFYRISQPAVRLFEVQDGPPVAPAGYAYQATVAYAWLPNTNVPNFQLREFHGDCTYNDNILYSHGAPDGCMHDGFRRVTGDVQPTADGTSCAPGLSFLWRVTVDTPISGEIRRGFDVVVNGTANTQPPPQSVGYNEPLGCVFAP